MPSVRRIGILAATLAAIAAGPVAAVRFAHVYRDRAGYPHRRPPRFTPADLGLPYQELTVRSDAGPLPAWFIPACDGAPGPGVVLVHGWDSARDRTLPHAVFLHAAGFHCLTFDVRGNGANPPELLPVSTGEFGADAAAAFEALMARPEVTRGAILGHSMGGTGAILAAVSDPRVAAVVSVSAPADARRMVRQTFRLAKLPFPEPIAVPLSWLTTRHVLRPRGHAPRTVSARHAVAHYDGPLLVAHARDDRIMPVEHARRIAGAALTARRHGHPNGRVEILVMRSGDHSWAYEDELFRSTVARFLARELGGPLSPEEAAEAAARSDARRLPEPETPLVGDRADNGGRALVGMTISASPDRETNGTATVENPAEAEPLLAAKR